MHSYFGSSLMYSSIALVSGTESGYTLLLGGEEPGKRAIAQSQKWLGGSLSALDLLKILNIPKPYLIECTYVHFLHSLKAVSG